MSLRALSGPGFGGLSLQDQRLAARSNWRRFRSEPCDHPDESVVGFVRPRDGATFLTCNDCGEEF